MNKLTEETPQLETILQSILFRVYAEEQSIHAIIKDLDSKTWYQISEALGNISDAALIEYIVTKEAEDIAYQEAEETAEEEVRVENLRTWVVKRIVGAILITFMTLSGALIIQAPDEIGEIIKHILDLISTKSSEE